MKSIPALLKRHAEQSPDRPAFTQAATGEVVSYRGLHQATAALTRWLRDKSVGVDTSVVYFVENSWLFFPLLGACAALGARLVPLDPRLHHSQIARVFRHCDPRVVVCHKEAPRRDGLHPQALVIAEAELHTQASLASSEEAPSDEDRVCLMLYTSGTTGTPKGVMLTQGNLLSMAADFLEVYSIGPNDRLYSILPVHHGNAVNVTGLIPLQAGAHTVLGKSFELATAYGYWEEVAAQGATICSLTPAIMALLLRVEKSSSRVPPPSVRFAFCGGADLPKDLWHRFEDTFGIPVYQGYGLTETTFWIACAPPDARRKYDTVGLPVQSAEIRIQADGEVWVRGPMVTPGYFRDHHPPHTWLTGDGFLRTGDIGFFDREGQLHISGRIKDIIKRKAVHITPEDIDCVLRQNESVAECKTIGTPDDLFGERVVSVCVPKPESAGPDFAPSVKAFARENLPLGLQPDAVFAMSHLPRGAAGKVSSAVLRDIVTLDLSRKIVETLLVRRYCRHRSADPTPLVDRLQSAVVGDRVVRFVMLWGCGEKQIIDERDELALRRLVEMSNEVRIAPQLRGQLTLVMSDLHARINGRAEDHIRRYLEQVEHRARAIGIDVVYESALWRKSGLEIAAVTGMAEAPELERLWERAEIRERLIKQAAKHSMLPSAADGARAHLATCLVERSALDREFAGFILFSYSGPEGDVCLPNLPKLYVYPHKRGLTNKPWFAVAAERDSRAKE